MNLVNTTDFAPHFLRRMVSWCARELELPMAQVRRAAFRNRFRPGLYSGHAWSSGRIVVSIAPAERFEPAKRDRMETLIEITAHELSHLLQKDTKTRRNGSWGGSEAATDWHASFVVSAFRAQRAVLLAAWEEPPANALRPKPSPVDQRRQKAETDLARWERKLKLAKTKVAKLRQRVAYYQKRLHTCPT